MWISKLSIKSTDQWLHIFRSGELWEKYNEGIVGTREEVIDALLELSDSDEILAKLQDRKLAKKKEQYEKLQPVGFEHAPASAKEHRKYLTDQSLICFERNGYDPSPHFDDMKFLHKNFSYNVDWTLNFLSIKKNPL